MKTLKQILFDLSCVLSGVMLVLLRPFFVCRREKVIFGAAYIINNKYWSSALLESGIDAETVMESYFSAINKRDDFDLYFEDLVPSILRYAGLHRLFVPFFVWVYLARRAKVLVMPFCGFVMGESRFWRLELFLVRLYGIKTVLIPFGADAYMYGRVKDTSLQNALMIIRSHYSKTGRETLITKQVYAWSAYADVVLAGFMGCDGMPRWDCCLPSFLHIDTRQWTPKAQHTHHNGRNGIVKVIHTPNHRGFKGTEYLVQAVNELKEEGLQVELLLLEKVPNNQVREMMHDADILAEQFIFTGYALSGIEGMASGLPVMSNLENENYTRVFRRYSFLNECPILSTTPENLKENLRLLVTNPDLRQALGVASRQYAQKYHSYETAQHLFSSILKSLDGEPIDLMNLYHPLLGVYPRSMPLVNHPLRENRYQG